MASGLKVSLHVKLRPSLTPILTLALIFVLTLVVAFAGSRAQAALRCEDTFVDQVELQKRLSQKLETDLDEARHLVFLNDEGELVISAAPHLLLTLETARDYLSLMGIETRTVLYSSIPALEFIANRSSGWNRMAESLRSNYGVRLVFSPHMLIAQKANAAWDSSTKTILVSRESLRVGRGERNNLEEFGHMKAALTKASSPNVFSGFFEVATPEQRLSPQALDYVQSMELDEVVRLAQNFNHLGLSLGKLDSHITRHELVNVARRGQEVVSIAQAYGKFNRSVAKRLKQSLLGSGPLLLEDGRVDEARAFAAAEGGVQVSIEQVSRETLRFRLEDDDRTSEIWVKNSDLWRQLLPRLRYNDTAAHTHFQTAFERLVQEWELETKPSLDALRTATDAILNGAENRTAQDLAKIASVPRTVVAPHLRRQRP